MFNGVAIGSQFRRPTSNKPCTNNLTFWESNLDFANNRMLDKSGLNNHAALSASNCIQLDGIAVMQHNNLSGVAITEYRGEQYSKNKNCIVSIVANTSFTVTIDSITHYFVRVIDAGLKIDSYRYMGCGNGLYNAGGELLTNGDNTTVFFETGGTDFTGGLHGGEVLNTTTLILDGAALNLASTSSNNYGKVVIFTELSDIYSNLNNANKIAEKSKIFTFDYVLKQLKLRVKTEATASFSVRWNYINMYSTSLLYDTAIVDTITYNMNIPELVPNSNYSLPCQFTSLAGYGVTTSVSIMQIPSNEVSQIMWMGNNALNRKLYWGNLTTRDWQVGDIYESEIISNYSFANPVNGNYAVTLTDATDDRITAMPKYLYVDPDRYQFAFEFQINAALTKTALLFTETDASYAQQGCRVEMLGTGQLTCRFYTNGVNDYYAHTPVLSINTWYKLEMLNRRLYLNGTLIKTFTTSSRGTTYATYPLQPAIWGRDNTNIILRNISHRGEKFNFNGQKQFIVGDRGSLLEINTSTTIPTAAKWAYETRNAFSIIGGYMDSGDNITDAHPTISSNNIVAPSGYLSYIKLSNGSEYTFAEGKEAIVYDIVNSSNLTIVTFASNMRVLSNFVDHWNLQNGFDLWINGSTLLRVPLKQDGTSIKGDGDTISTYTWSKKLPASLAYHNLAETKITLPSSGLVDVYNIESDTDYLSTLFSSKVYQTITTPETLVFTGSSTPSVGNYGLLLNSSTFQLSTYVYSNSGSSWTTVWNALATLINAEGYYSATVNSNVISIVSGTRILSTSASGSAGSNVTKSVVPVGSTLVQIGVNKILNYSTEITDIDCLIKTTKYNDYTIITDDAGDYLTDESNNLIIE